jgi:hypothetical protein
MLGAGAALAATAVLIAYWATVGLDKADKLASVFGGFVGLLGLGLTLYSTFSQRKEIPQATPPDGIHNDVHGPVHGSVVQSNTIHGSITFGGSAPVAKLRDGTKNE